jgi:sulfate permease, SulP family
MNRSLLRGRFSAADRPSRRIYGPEQEALLQRLRHRVTLIELEGALFFGSADRLAAEADTLAPDCRCLVLDLHRVSTIDESGAVLLQQLSRQLAQRGILLMLASVSAGNAHGQRLRSFGCFRESPREDWWPDVDRAIEAAELQAAVPLTQTSLLRVLDAGQIEQVRAMLQAQWLPAGALLFREGDPGDCLYVLTQGSISIVGGTTEPRQRYVSFSPGIMLGEIAMLDGGLRTADAVADSDSVLHALTREAFDTLATTDPVLGQHLVRNIALHLSERLRGAAAAWRASAA